ncbi:MAG: SDR family oxidoreductase [Nitrososphaeria archaeon]|jgi:NAD(P)-dependent dehydrogenase (short-subunit alcohol dehydrogenase family)
MEDIEEDNGSQISKSERVALVSGSTNNVGKGVAEILSKDGFLVVVTSRHEDEAKEVADHLSKKGDYYQVDFSNAEQITSLFSFLKKKYGRLDVLVNNVAYTKNESIMDCTLETWEYTINTNLRSYYLCTRYAAEIMKEHGGGNIINITISRNRGIKNKFSYSVSKGGVNSLTMSAAVDLAPFNIRVNAISIGPTGTPVGQKDYPERTRRYESPEIPAGHIGDPSDIANIVSFLVSEKARYIYGAILAVDGGSSISH